MEVTGMNYAVILSGGIGTRMNTNGFPKQYLKVQGKPILFYPLETFDKTECIDKIIIVANEIWREDIRGWLAEYGIQKFDRFADPGESRQGSILNGLLACMETSASDKDRVIIHDGVRPLVSSALITECFRQLDEHDGCMPVLHINDTVYQSFDGKSISTLLDRSTLFKGQSPETFHLWAFTELNRSVSAEELNATRGTSEIAFRHGMDVALIDGEDTNFKLTTPADMAQFESIVSGQAEKILNVKK